MGWSLSPRRTPDRKQCEPRSRWAECASSIGEVRRGLIDRGRVLLVVECDGPRGRAGLPRPCTNGTYVDVDELVKSSCLAVVGAEVVGHRGAETATAGGLVVRPIRSCAASVRADVASSFQPRLDRPPPQVLPGVLVLQDDGWRQTVRRPSPAAGSSCRPPLAPGNHSPGTVQSGLQRRQASPQPGIRLPRESGAAIGGDADSAPPSGPQRLPPMATVTGATGRTVHNALPRCVLGGGTANACCAPTLGRIMRHGGTHPTRGRRFVCAGQLSAVQNTITAGGGRVAAPHS